MPARFVYKICSRADWQEAERAGVYRGSADDERDGFIHLSTAHQVAGTAAKWFRDRTDLVLVTLEASALGDRLRYEPSRGGALFPHHYGELPTSAARSIDDLPWRDGAHVVPRLDDEPVR